MTFNVYNLALSDIFTGVVAKELILVEIAKMLAKSQRKSVSNSS